MDNLNEIDNLEEIKGVGKTTAEKFRKAGYKTLADLAKITPEELAQKTKIHSTIAQKDYKFKEEILKEVVEEVSDLLEDDPVLRGKVIEAALQKSGFRSRVANYVAKKLT